MIDQLARVLAAVFPERDGEHLAEALWLAAMCGGPDTGSLIPDEPREDGSASAEVDRLAPAGQVQVSSAVADLALANGEPLPTAQTAARGIEVGLRIPTTPPTLTAVTALSLFRRVHRPGRPVVDVDATVEATADAQQLVVVTRPDRERGLDVVIVVDQTPVAMVWAETIAELEGTLRRTGAFRSVTRWSLDRSAPTALVGEPLIRDSAGAAHRTDHIIDPAGRRLVLLLSDGAADDWREGWIWQVLGRWAQAMPTVLVQLLPESYWGYTAIGQPTVVIRSRRPAGPNSSFDVRTAWWSDGDDARASVPVPVIGLNPDAIVRWTRAVLTGSTWAEAVWAHLPQASVGLTVGSRLSAAERVRAFQARASAGAQRLARVLAGAPLLSLPLIRVLHEHLVPQPTTEHLAELLVSGLLERLPGDPGRGNLLLRFRSGIAELLYQGTTISQEWDVFELLTRYLEREAGSGAAVRAVLADPDGTTVVEGGLVPFAAMGRGMALRLGLEVGEAAESPADRDGAVQQDGASALTAPSPAEPSTRARSAILCVAGLNLTGGAALTEREWAPAIADGLQSSGDSANADALARHGISVAWYADLFREAADRKQAGPFMRSTVFERAFPPRLSQSTRDMIGWMSRYFSDPELRHAVRDRIAAAVTDETRVIVAFSIGAIAAYEALCANPEWRVRVLITLGSPLGNTSVFDRLDPTPSGPGRPRGRWPGQVETWVDIADRGDLVAVGGDMHALFGDSVERHVISGTKGHRAGRYLASPVTGAAISAALRRADGPHRQTASNTNEEAADGGRRYLLLCAVSGYTDPDLATLPDEKPEIIGIFESLGYTHVPLAEGQATKSAVLEAVKQFCRSPDRRPDDLVVLYLNGHGALTRDGEYRFPAADTVVNRVANTGIAVSDLAHALFSGSIARRHLVIVNSSYAGRAAEEFASLARRSSVRSFAAVASTGAQSAAVEDRFSDALVGALKHWLAEPALPQPRLSLDDLVRRINDRLAPTGSQRAMSVTVNRDRAFSTAFFARSRRRASPPDIVGSFVGRNRAIAAISFWLVDPSDPRPLIVTGDPGSGKTALLTFLTTVSDPEVRRDIPPDRLPSSLPPMNAIAGMISIRAQDTGEILDRLMPILGVARTGGGIAPDLDALMAAIGSRKHPATVVIDGVDESLNPDLLITALLAPLIRIGYGRLRLLLATRRNLLPRLRSGSDVLTVDLNADEYADPEAIRIAVRRILVESSLDGTALRSAPPAVLERVVDDLVQTANGSFTYALIAAKALAAIGELPDPSDPRSSREIPGSLSELVDWTLRMAVGSQVEYARLKALLRALAAADGDGATVEQWLDVAEQTNPAEAFRDRDVEALLASRAAGLIQVDGDGDGGVGTRYRLSHAAIAEHLLAEEPSPAPAGTMDDHRLADLAREAGRWEEAEAGYRRALTVYEDLGDRLRMADSFHQLGVVAQQQGRLAEAEQAYRQALELKLEFGDRHGAASTYHQLGTVAQQQGRLADAEQALRQALELLLEFGDRHGAASTYHQLGTVALEQRRFADTVTYLVRAAANWYTSTEQWPPETITAIKKARDHLDIDHYQRLLAENVPADLLGDLQTSIDQPEA